MITWIIYLLLPVMFGVEYNHEMTNFFAGWSAVEMAVEVVCGAVFIFSKWGPK